MVMRQSLTVLNIVMAKLQAITAHNMLRRSSSVWFVVFCTHIDRTHLIKALAQQQHKPLPPYSEDSL